MSIQISASVPRIIDRKQFFKSVRTGLFSGMLRQNQVDGMNGILDEWEARYSEQDDRYLAYMLATTFHETAMCMNPIEEYGKGRGRPYGVTDPVTGHAYYGRGFVQLTWRANYEKMGALLGINLINYPERALDLAVATSILFTGMSMGLFTGRKLGDYFSPGKADWVNARRIINGLDRAQLIAGYGRDFHAAISYIPGQAMGS